MRLPAGCSIILPIDSRFASEVFVTGANVDWGSEALLANLLDSRGVFLDIGANIGYYSLYIAPLVDEVYAFEPDPRARRTLERNMATVKGGHVIPFAVGNSESWAKFALAACPETSHLSTDSQGIEVNVVTIDGFVARNRIDDVAAIKIDTEGADLDVLRGARTTLEKKRPAVLQECQLESELFRLVSSVGYRVFGVWRTGRRRRIMLSEFQSGVTLPGSVKMIFLLPEEKTKKLETATGLDYISMVGGAFS